MKARFSWKDLDTMDLEILNPDYTVVEDGGGPFVVTLRNPRSEHMRNLYRKQEEEFSNFKARLPQNARATAQKPKDMNERHGRQILQAAHVRWQNPPVYDDAGNQMVDVDFMGEDFAAFLEENDIYTVQVTQALSNANQNFTQKVTEKAPTTNSSPSAKSKSS